MSLSNKKIAIICFLVTFLIYGAQGSYTPYITSFYQLYGLGKFEIGLLSAIGPIVAITIQPLWGILSDKTNKRKLVLQILCLSSALVMLLYIIYISPILLVLYSFLYSSFSMAIIPLANAIITYCSNKYDFDYAHVRLGGPIGHSILPLLVSLVILIYPKSMFLFALIIYVFLFIVISKMDESLFTLPSGPTNNTKKLFKNKEIYLIFVLAILNMFGGTIINTYLGPKLLDIGYSQQIIGQLTFVLSICELPVLLFIKKFTKKFSSLSMMYFAVFISALRLILASTNSILLIYICQAIEGLTYMVAFYAAVTYISKNCVEGAQSRAQTILVMLESGVGAVLANTFGGYLIKSIGISKSFCLLSFSIFIILIIIYFTEHKFFRIKNN